MTLRADSLHFAYGQAPPAVSGVDFELGEGEFVALIGPNGSGKSTLLRLLAGILPPSSGRAEWRGRDIAHWEARSRARHVAYLPQQIIVPEGYRARDVVELGRHPHGEALSFRLDRDDREAVEAALADTDGAVLAERFFDTLSGGERQRVLLASALAQGGELLLLDEPTAALDLHHQIAGMRRLRALAERGRTVLCATHDLNLAAATAHRMILLRSGRLVALGEAAEVLRPELLREVYGEGVWVGPHPTGGGIAVLPELSK